MPRMQSMQHSRCGVEQVPSDSGRFVCCSRKIFAQRRGVMCLMLRLPRALIAFKFARRIFRREHCFIECVKFVSERTPMVLQRL